MTFKKPKREINKVYIHCSASDVKSHDNIETIRGWHVQDNKWSDIGYHYFIDKIGCIEEGRNLELIPSAQKEHNTGSITICLSGLKEFTQEQFDSLKELCEEINTAYYKITFHGHCEVSKKTCPVFDYKNILSLDDKGYMSLTATSNVYVEGLKSPEILEIKSTILPTQPKEKMIFPLAISLVKLFAPSIINKFKRAGRDLAEDTAEKLIKKAEEKLGFKITDVKSAERAKDQLDSKDLFELEKIALKTNAAMFRDELKYGEDLNRSWKDEFVTVVTFVTFMTVLVMAYKDPVNADKLVSVIKALLLTPFGALFIFVGVSAIGGKHIISKLADKFIK